jgi:hypothetical protein
MANSSVNETRQMRIAYSEVTEPDFQARIRARYGADIQSLSALGFDPLCYYREQLGALSALFQIPALLQMLLKKEVIVVEGPLRLGVACALLAHTTPATIAVPMARGIKLYSDFTEGSLLVSCTFISHRASHPGSRIMQITSQAGIEDLWRLHQERIRQLQSEGKILQTRVSFEHYVQMSQNEDRSTQYVFRPRVERGQAVAGTGNRDGS